MIVVYHYMGTIFQPYHGQNKLHFNKIMMMSILY